MITIYRTPCTESISVKLGRTDNNKFLIFCLELLHLRLLSLLRWYFFFFLGLCASKHTISGTLYAIILQLFSTPYNFNIPIIYFCLFFKFVDGKLENSFFVCTFFKGITFNSVMQRAISMKQGPVQADMQVTITYQCFLHC